MKAVDSSTSSVVFSSMEGENDMEYRVMRIIWDGKCTSGQSA
jgi:hypothetical protein